jgi:hypothetical protein
MMNENPLVHCKSSGRRLAMARLLGHNWLQISFDLDCKILSPLQRRSYSTQFQLTCGLEVSREKDI